MPELPEVETIKRGLEKTIVGLKIADIEVLSEKNFIGNPKDIIGGVIKLVDRRAKILVIKIDARSQTPEANYLLIHLKMTGQLVWRREIKYQKLNIKNKKDKNRKSPYDLEKLPNKYTRVIVGFDNGSRLYFNDLRKFGWMKVIKTKNQKLKIKNTNEKLKNKQNLNMDQIVGEKYGPEPFDKEFTIGYLKETLGKWGRPVKLLLMDQKKIAGIGNIYANEALFCAGIAPHHRGKELANDHPEKVKKLYFCIKKILREAIRLGGSTASDDAYRNVKGERGRMQEKLKVYGRVGQPCPNKCGKTIKRMTLSGRGTFFCPACQR